MGPATLAIVTPGYRPSINGHRALNTSTAVSLPCPHSTMRDLFRRCLPIMAVIIVCSLPDCSADAALIGGPISESLKATLPSTLVLCISDAVSLDDTLSREWGVIYLSMFSCRRSAAPFASSCCSRSLQACNQLIDLQVILNQVESYGMLCTTALLQVPPLQFYDPVSRSLTGYEVDLVTLIAGAGCIHAKRRLQLDGLLSGHLNTL